MDIGGGTYESWQPKDHDGERARETGEKKERFRLACIKVLSERGTLGRDALIRAVRERGLKANNDQLRGWLSEFAADPASGVEHTGGEGRTAGYETRPLNRGSG